MSYIKTWLLSLTLITPAVIAAPNTEQPADLKIKPESESNSITTPDNNSAFLQAETKKALNLGQLESIQAETIIYEAQLERAKTLNELQKNGYDRSLDLSFDQPPPIQSRPNEVYSQGVNQNSTLPKVIEISKIGKIFTAQIAFSNGNKINVKTGNRIPGTDYIVRRININEVVITSPNNQLISLSFSG
ncbi:type IV pilus biogenesis protein PilP (plasmid) [Xenorhabdus stockiae]|uniref:type IV pilus biogenesis protein PilP n=1 Tax=Xenorhabdus stockiae TaxID=351614 RepID=UPI003CF60544